MEESQKYIVVGSDIKIGMSLGKNDLRSFYLKYHNFSYDTSFSCLENVIFIVLFSWLKPILCGFIVFFFAYIAIVIECYRRLVTVWGNKIIWYLKEITEIFSDIKEHFCSLKYSYWEMGDKEMNLLIIRQFCQNWNNSIFKTNGDMRRRWEEKYVTKIVGFSKRIGIEFQYR